MDRNHPDRLVWRIENDQSSAVRDLRSHAQMTPLPLATARYGVAVPSMQNSLALDTSANYSNPNSKPGLYPSQFPTYYEDIFADQRRKMADAAVAAKAQRESQVQGHLHGQGQTSPSASKSKVMFITGIVLIIMAVAAASVAIALFLIAEPGTTAPGTTTTVDNPLADVDPSKLVKGAVTLKNLLYDDSLQDKNSVLFQTYKKIFCDELWFFMKSYLPIDECSVTGMSEGSVNVDYAFSLSSVAGLTTEDIDEKAEQGVTDMTDNSNKLSITSKQVHRDACAAMNTTARPCEQICYPNVTGNIMCGCYKGYTLHTDKKICIDVDDCGQDVSPCGTVGQCVNLDGSYRCDCPSGYQSNSNNTKCLDINECSNNNANCSHMCTNLPGTYKCDCPPGYQLNHKTCEDIDECASKPCLNNGTCVDNINNFECICPDNYIGEYCQVHLDGTCEVIEICRSGYTKETNGSCTDIDECDDSPCQFNCTNTLGSYICTCGPGYIVDIDGKNCTRGVLVVNEQTVNRFRGQSMNVTALFNVSEAVGMHSDLYWFGPGGEAIGDDVAIRTHALQLGFNGFRISPLTISNMTTSDNGTYTCMAEYRGQRVAQLEILVNVSKCSVEEVDCDDRCVLPEFICDGRLHCKNGHDEIDCDCDYIFGVDGGVKCTRTGLCIEHDRWCDGLVDCHDSSDEQHKCDTDCPSGYFRCNGTERKCIPQDLVCNYRADCPDASDETQGCVCPPDNGNPSINAIKAFQSVRGYTAVASPTAPTFTTLPMTFTPYPSTKTPYPTTKPPYPITNTPYPTAKTPYPTTNAPYPTYTPPWSTLYPNNTLPWITPYPTSPSGVPTVTISPRSNWTRCDNGQCVPGYYICNGFPDCVDGSDEKIDICRPCSPGRVRCNRTKYCIPRNFLCDGDNDCRDYEDESKCNVTCSSGYIACNNTNRCVSSYDICDMYNECGDFEDETDCSYCRTNIRYLECNNTNYAKVRRTCTDVCGCIRKKN